MEKKYCLSDINPGESAVVKQLLSKGSIRRRLLDIGLVEHTKIECLGRSPAGDPSAFLIKGAVIAIRLEDCQNILIEPLNTSSSEIKKKFPKEKVIAIAGNPNVGKSTVFNALTGMKQHTGNWPGKTVSNAMGHCATKNQSYLLVDIPGTYSLMAHSKEEEVARDFICFGEPDAVVVVCDATCLERNLNLVLQIMEITKKVIVCINLMDEAKRKGICVDLEKLSKRLHVPVVGVTARKKKSLVPLLDALDYITAIDSAKAYTKILYPNAIEDALSIMETTLRDDLSEKINTRWLCLKLLEEDNSLSKSVHLYLENNIYKAVHDKNDNMDEKGEGEEKGEKNVKDEEDEKDEKDEKGEKGEKDEKGEKVKKGEKYVKDKNEGEEKSEFLNTWEIAKERLKVQGITYRNLPDKVVESLSNEAESICKEVLEFEKENYNANDRKLDKLLTSRWAGYPIMIGLLAFIFWLTIVGANYPSKLLSTFLFGIEAKLTELFEYFLAPWWLHGVLVLGVYRVLAWVISVMLPPMAIFFPLFTILEDAGYLPRIAYNMDKHFKKCAACGKQALTMCMGFGCNAVGISGCRIIDSKRERLLAMITNSFVPCNGRFPTLIAIITMFFVGVNAKAGDSVLSALLLTVLIVFGIIMTFLVSSVLSKTVLKGVPSSFILELPPYRKPQFGKVILRSIFDRTLFVLGRAVMVAAPVGFLIWVMANIYVGDASLFSHCASFLDPFAKLLGMDGVILLAFILGLPANEIVVPIIIMAYMSQGSIMEMDNLTSLKTLLVENGWTITTAVSTMIFSLMHWPCSTALITMKKETNSYKWTALAFIIPTLIGMFLCFAFTGIYNMFFS